MLLLYVNHYLLLSARVAFDKAMIHYLIKYILATSMILYIIYYNVV
jgi:hypothetical protein